ncbi:hypothetical protein DIPPA_32863 [Diplonema papillatum]|nr:hypothetical protein DIPPA_32863 [Diplonema papillatum]
MDLSSEGLTHSKFDLVARSTQAKYDEEIQIKPKRPTEKRKAEKGRQARSVREAAIADTATSTEQSTRRRAVMRPASQVAQTERSPSQQGGDDVMQDEGEA